MKDEVETAISALLGQGLEVRVKRGGLLGEIFIVYLRDGTKYVLSAGNILKLKAEKRLNANGIMRTAIRGLAEL